MSRDVISRDVITRVDCTSEFLLMSAKIWSVLYEIERSDLDKIFLATYYIPKNLQNFGCGHLAVLSIRGLQASNLSLVYNSEKLRLSSFRVIVYHKYLVIADL